MSSKLNERFKFTDANGQSRGPYYGYQIRHMILNGAITADTDILPTFGEGRNTVSSFMESTETKAAGNQENNVPNKPCVQVVQVQDFDMPFGSMVGFMIKWALASLPLAVIGIILWLVLLTL